MDIIVQWATILSPIIAVVIAILASRSSKKDTDKKLAVLEESTHEQVAALDKSTKEQIAALELSTKKQLESIKKFAKIQIETSQIQIGKELWEARKRYLQASKEQGDALEYDRFMNLYGGGYDSMRQRDEKKRKLSSEKDFYDEYAEILELSYNRIEKLSKELEGM